MPKFETYVPGKGEGTNRYQFMQVLVMFVEAGHRHDRLSFVYLMDKLDASESFIQDIIGELIEIGAIRLNETLTDNVNKGVFDYIYNWQN